jgi:hypothetical protein
MFQVLLLAILTGFSTFSIVSADVLLIEEVRQADRMELPANGTPSEQVRARFGDPVETHAAVGNPPIIRWDYDRWSVYFEYDLVLFTVLHKGEVLDKNGEQDG